MPRTVLPPLDKVDPAKAWLPWEPSDKEPWNLKWASHLYRRATFGPIPPSPRKGVWYDHLARLREAVKGGLDAALEQVLSCEAQDPNYRGFEELFIKQAGIKTASRNNPSELRGWWLYCMWYSPQPLREKMTLFWHNHFATSVVKVQKAGLMFQQNLLLRRQALGKFEPFLQEMSKNAAMLVYLDSNSNVKGKPNENYARELMELFSLGVGNYTEQDIREAARAFTGWHTDGDRFDFNKFMHDDEDKTVFGEKGDWNGDDIVRLVFKKPVAARFLVRKLYRYFISETSAPPDALLEPLADSFRKSDYDINALVRTMLRSRHFFSDYAYRQRLKSPVEFVLGAARDAGHGFVEPRTLANRTEEMGQLLFAPPNVKGWEGGRSWLNTATVLARHNFAQTLTMGSGQINLGDPESGTGIAVDPSAYVRRQQLKDPKEIVALLVDMLLQGDVSEAARDKLNAFLADAKPETDEWNQRIRDTFHALMTMPEYQLA